MRKYVAFLLLLATVVVLFGCTSDRNEFVEPVKFYYQRSELTYGKADSVILHELFEAQGHSNDYEYLINQYLRGPKSQTMTRTFPRNVSVESFRIEGEQAYLDLSSNFALLSGLDLTMACACLTKTVTELTGTTALHISAGNTPLDGNQTISMCMEDILLLDRSTESTIE